MPFSIRFYKFYRCPGFTGRPIASLLLLLSPALFLTACGRQGGYAEYGAPPYGAIGEVPSAAPTHYYPPPGPPEDPWGPYIHEAASRYAVPERWVRAVMQQESGGQEQAVSPVGAMGLMQVMPGTYDGLRMRYGLGDDPYDPHNNILAGTAYIREMYDRYGAPGFLAAYNAGPDRVDSYLAGAGNLPDETVNYLASVTPNLGTDVPLSGPLARYASARGLRRTSPSVASLAAGCDLNAAYDPNHPCSSLMRAASAPAPVQLAFAPQTGVGGCDLSAAYDPGHPCTSVGAATVAAAPAAPPQPPQPVVAEQAAPRPAFVQQASAGCDLNAAYDPSRPCTSATPAAPAPVVAQAAMPSSQPVQLAAAGYDVGAADRPDQARAPARQPLPEIRLAAADNCDVNAAYDPDRPCRAMSAVSTAALPPPAAAEPDLRTASLAGNQHPPRLSEPPVRSAALGGAEPHTLAIPSRDWGIQVGAFANPALARAVAEGARAQAPGQLRAAAIALPPTPNGGSLLYRARLVHLSESAAANACTNLNRRQLPCVVVQPTRS